MTFSYVVEMNWIIGQLMLQKEDERFITFHKIFRYKSGSWVNDFLWENSSRSYLLNGNVDNYACGCFSGAYKLIY